MVLPGQTGSGNDRFVFVPRDRIWTAWTVNRGVCRWRSVVLLAGWREERGVLYGTIMCAESCVGRVVQMPKTMIHFFRSLNNIHVYCYDTWWCLSVVPWLPRIFSLATTTTTTTTHKQYCRSKIMYWYEVLLTRIRGHSRRTSIMDKKFLYQHSPAVQRSEHNNHWKSNVVEASRERWNLKGFGDLQLVETRNIRGAVIISTSLLDVTINGFLWDPGGPALSRILTCFHIFDFAKF